MEEWKEYKLGGICDFREGYVNPPQGNAEYFDGNIKWLRATDLNDGYVYNTSRTLTELGFKSAKKSAILFKPETIAISKSGTIGRLGILKDYMCGNRAVINIIPHDNVDTFFVFYALKSYQKYFPSMAVGSVQKNLYISILEDLKIGIPSLYEQQKIVSVLKSFDDKIEANRRINSNLEQQAQALFKSWFVDFEPFRDKPFVESELGMIPEGWKVYRLSDFLPVKTGKKDANVAKGGAYPFFSCSQDITWTDNYSFSGSAILVAGNGDFNVKMYNGQFEAYQRTYVLMPYNPSYTAWLYYAVKYNLDKITSAARGSVIKFITKGNLSDFLFAAPNDLKDFEIIKIFDTIRQKIFANVKQSRNLANIRDTLLPRLMSGELEIQDIEESL